MDGVGGDEDQEDRVEAFDYSAALLKKLEDSEFAKSGEEEYSVLSRTRVDSEVKETLFCPHFSCRDGSPKLSIDDDGDEDEAGNAKDGSIQAAFKLWWSWVIVASAVVLLVVAVVL
eukprot:GABV01007677.1.p1 GENE.GABV01007677.1~~GABV01007677.1.p1  ORF type:complete len:124 (+),score=61.79 GABV01007677.1:26-373(+)